MYDELYIAWRLEIENSELGSLHSDFYARLSNYLRRIKEENHMQDQKNLKTTLLKQEETNVTRMAQELISARYRKLVKMIISGKTVPLDCLTSEEQKLCANVMPSAEAYTRFETGILAGKLFEINVKTSMQKVNYQISHKRITLRFLKSVPPIIGADMKSYGPFLVEDVASVPLENAKILVKQGLANKIEIQ